MRVFEALVGRRARQRVYFATDCAALPGSILRANLTYIIEMQHVTELHTHAALRKHSWANIGGEDGDADKEEKGSVLSDMSQSAFVPRRRKRLESLPEADPPMPGAAALKLGSR